MPDRDEQGGAAMDIKGAKRARARHASAILLMLFATASGAYIAFESGYFYYVAVTICVVYGITSFAKFSHYATKLSTYRKFSRHLQEHADRLAANLGYESFDAMEQREAERLNLKLKTGLDLNMRLYHFSKAHGYEDIVEAYKEEVSQIF